MRHGFGDGFASHIESWTHLLCVCPLDPDSSDFGDVCALYAPFLHQLTMQSSLFERGCPVLVVVCVARKLRPCPSYSRRRDRINLGLWRSLYKGGGAGYETSPGKAYACISSGLRTSVIMTIHMMQWPPPGGQ